MNQRGFISSLYLYAILAVVIAGMGWFLYQKIKQVGELEATIAVQQKAIEESEKLRRDAETAIATRDASIAATRTEINRYRSKLKALEAVNAELAAWSNTPLPAAVIRLLCELTNSHSLTCMPTTDPDAKPTTTGMGWKDERRSTALVYG